MSKKLKKGLKKSVSVVTAITTIVWLSGLALVLTPAVSVVADERPSVTVEGVTIYDGDLISSNATNPDGTPTYESLDIYIAKVVGAEKYKRLILNPQVFDSYGHLNWSDVKEVDQSVMDAFTTSCLIREDGDTKVYALAPDDDTGTKSWINLTAEEFLGATPGAYSTNDSDAIYTVNSTDAGNYTTTGDITTVAALETYLADGTLPGVTGGLTVALSSTTPASATIPYYSTNVGYLKFDLTAGSEGDVTINSMTFTRSGAGSSSDFANVYLYEGSTRLTSGRSVSSATNQVTFSNLGLTVSAGTTKTLDLVADLDTSATHTGSVDAFSLTAVDTAATLTGVPVTGNAMSIGSVASGTLTIAKSGSLSNPTVGEADVAVAQFKLTAGTEDVNVSRITLYQAGSTSSANITDLKLYQGSTLLAETAAMSGDYAIFDLDPVYTISNGQNKVLTVKATVGGRANDTVKFYLEESADLKATGGTYGFGQRITNNYDGTGVQYSEVTLQGGSITLAFNGPTATNVSLNSYDVPFMNLAMTSTGQNAEVRSITLYLCRTDGADMTAAQAAEFTDIKISDGTTTLSGPKDATATPAGTMCPGSKKGVTLTYTDRWSINSGETKNLVVSADIGDDASTAITGNSYGIILKAFGSTDIKSLDTGQYVTDIVPSSNISGNAMTVVASSLTVNLASTPVSTTVVKRSTDVDSVGFLFKTGTQSGVTITDLTLTGQGSIDGATYSAASLDDVVASCSLYEGTTKITGPKSPNSSGKITFTNFTLSISSGITKKLTVKCNLNSVIGGSTSDSYWVGIDAAGDITVEDDDGNSVTPTDGDATWSDPKNSASGVVMTVADSGSIASALDSGTPSADIVVAGSSDVDFTKVKLSATNEAMKVSKLRITNVNNATYGDDEIASITLSYPKEDGSTGTAVGYLSGGSTDFTLPAGSEMYIAKDESAVLTIKSTLNTIAGGADSGNQPRLGLSASGFEAIGVDSGVSKTSITARNGNAMVVRKSKPTVTLATLPSTTLADGTMTIAKFTVTADSGADVAVKKLTFDLTLSDADNGNQTDLSISSPAIYDAVDPGTALTATFGDGNGGTAYETQKKILVKLTNEEVIPAGTSKTYLLKATISHSAQYDSVLTRLAAPKETSVRTAYLDDNTNELLVLDSAQNGGGTEYSANIIWSDNSAGTSHSDNSAGSGSGDWTNGYLVKTLPSDYQTLSR